MGIILHSFRDSFFSFSFLDGGGVTYHVYFEVVDTQLII